MHSLYASHHFSFSPFFHIFPFLVFSFSSHFVVHSHKVTTCSSQKKGWRERLKKNQQRFSSCLFYLFFFLQGKDETPQNGDEWDSSICVSYLFLLIFCLGLPTMISCLFFSCFDLPWRKKASAHTPMLSLAHHHHDYYYYHYYYYYPHHFYIYHTHTNQYRGVCLPFFAHPNPKKRDSSA